MALGAQLWLRFFVNDRSGTDAENQYQEVRPPNINRQFWEVEPLKIIKYIFLFSVVITFSLLFYQSYKQYQFWSQNEVSRYLLPPHQSINYFIFYALARFFAPYLISLAAAVLFLISANLLNKKYQERFFYPEEYYLGAISLFLVGHPGWLFYLALLIVIYLIIHLVALMRNNADSNAEQRGMVRRISLYYLWLAVAIFVIIFNKLFLSSLSWWQLLKI